jgi:hypothetical protein
MSALPPEDEKEGWKAYEQARAFENLRRKKIGWVYAAQGLLGALMAAVMWKARHPFMAVVFLGLAILLPVFTGLRWRFFAFRHAENLSRLAALEKRYGTDLPWLEVERHLAAVAELREELAQERMARE